MKKIFLSVVVLLALSPVFGQSISKITFSLAGNLESIEMDLGSDVVMRISDNGSILKWGYDVLRTRGYENYTDRLDPYMGRVDYYSPESDEAYRGKIKSIGSVSFSYYASFEGAEYSGKLKSIGSRDIQYYPDYENEAYKGKIKNIGPSNVTWYASYDNEAFRGKLKSIGNTTIGYYGSFDDKEVKGKVKNIDGSTYTYYSSYDLREYKGRLKSGAQVQFINGIKYFLKN